MTIVLLPLAVDEITQDDIGWMERVLVDSEDGYDVGTVLALATERKCRVWRCVGDGEGVVVTTLDKQPNGINCVVWFLAGRGLMRHARSLFEQVSHYAKSQGASAVVAHTRSEGLIRLFLRIGMRKTSTVVRAEV